MVNTTRRLKMSGLDLADAGAPPALTEQAQTALFEGGLLVAGAIQRQADGGRTVVATQFFLPAG